MITNTNVTSSSDMAVFRDRHIGSYFQARTFDARYTIPGREYGGGTYGGIVTDAYVFASVNPDTWSKDCTSPNVQHAVCDVTGSDVTENVSFGDLSEATEEHGQKGAECSQKVTHDDR
jgi:hypothetical protein